MKKCRRLENKKDFQIFKNEQFGEIRTVEIDEKQYFVGVDVARALGYSNTNDAILRHCKGVVKHEGLNYRGNSLSLITEGDVYRLVMKSKLPQAEKFESWVCDEILPTIRKHGMYATDELLDNPDLLIEIATKLKEERIARLKVEQQLEEQKPKVIFADAVSVAENSILVGDLAKLLRQNNIKIGQNRLFEWLRKEGYLISRKGESLNQPTQYSMDLELFEVKVRSITNSNGSVITTKTPKVTGKGQIYFINKFRKVVSND